MRKVKEVGLRESPGGYYAYKLCNVNKPAILSHPLEYDAYICENFHARDAEGKELWVDALNGIPIVNNNLPFGRGSNWDNPVTRQALNSCLDKLYEKFDQSEALLVAFKEREEAFTTIKSGAIWLARTVRAVARLDKTIVRRVLRYHRRSIHYTEIKKLVKKPAGLWLTYWFGIVPTISDIQHACGVLGREFPTLDVVARSGGSDTIVAPRIPYQWYGECTYNVRVKMGGQAFAKNENTALLSQLGIMSPLSAAWELVPFSWCVDYMVNVGQLVKNCEPRFPGFNTRDEYTTIFVTAKGKLNYAQYIDDLIDYHSKAMRRRTSWPLYKLVLSPLVSVNGKQASYLIATFLNLAVSAIH